MAGTIDAKTNALTADGDVGVLTISSTTGYRRGAKLWLVSSTQPGIKLEIVSVLTSTTLKVKVPGTYGVFDASDYLVADSATVNMPSQEDWYDDDDIEDQIEEAGGGGGGLSEPVTLTQLLTATDIDASGDVTVGGTLDVTGTLTGVNADFTGNVTVGGTLYVTGALTAADDLTAESIIGQLIVASPSTDPNSITLRSYTSNGATAQTSIIIDTYTTLSNAASKLLSVRNGNIEKFYIDKDGVLSSPTGSSLSLKSNVTNSGTNVAYILDSVALTGSTVLLSIRNNGTEHLSLNRAGVLRISQSTGSISAPWFGDIQGVARITPNMFTANDGTDYRGRASDGATAVSHKFGGTVALTTAGAKIAGFYNDASLLTTLKASIDKDGEYECTTAGAGIILKSPDGTRYRITVANGGAISASAV